MVNIYDKKNDVPYYIVGSLATLALLASGVFAAAPAILTALPSLEFLAPVVTLALSLGTPLIAVCAAFSAVVIAFSAIAIKKNRTISEKDTELADKKKVIEAKDKAIAKQEAQLTEEVKKKDDVIASMKDQLAEKDRDLKGKDVVISCVDKQLAGKDVVISEMKDQLAKKAREIEEVKRQAESVEGNMYPNTLFGNASDDGVTQPKSDLHEVLHNGKKLVFAPELSDYLSKERLSIAKQLIRMGIPFSETAPESVNGMEAESEPDIQQAESTKAVSKQAEFLNIITTKYKESNWLSTTKTQTLGALSLMASYSVLYHLFNQVSSDISLDNNNSTGVDDLHNDSFPILEAGIGATFGFMGLVAQYFTGSIASALSFANKSINSASPPANPFNPETTLDDKSNQTKAMFEAAEESAKKNFGVELEFEESTLIQTNGTVEQNNSTFVYPMMKDNPCYTIGSNVLPGFVCNNRATDYITPPMRANGTVERDVLTSVYSKMKDMFFSLLTSNDPTQRCAVLNVRKHDNQTFASNPCAPGDHQVPLPGLKHVALCCPTMPETTLHI